MKSLTAIIDPHGMLLNILLTDHDTGAGCLPRIRYDHGMDVAVIEAITLTMHS